MLARQRCERRERGRRRTEPDQLLDLGGSRHRTVERQFEQICLYPMPRFVRRLGLEATEKFRFGCLDHQSKLFHEFTLQGGEGCFASFDLSACLHERGRSTLAHQQETTLSVTNDSGRDPHDQRSRIRRHKLNLTRADGLRAKRENSRMAHYHRPYGSPLARRLIGNRMLLQTLGSISFFSHSLAANFHAIRSVPT